MEERKRKGAIYSFFTKKPKQEEDTRVPSTLQHDDSVRNSGTCTSAAVECTITAEKNDIGFLLSRSLEGAQKLTDEEKLYLLCDAWTPNPSYPFPSTGKRNLKFQHRWLDCWKWLTYSKYMDGAFYKSCALFSSSWAGHGGQPLGKLVKNKFDNWKDAVEEFRRHDESGYHKTSTLKAANFLSIAEKKQQPVDLQIDKGLRNQTESNRRRLIPIIETIILCRRQGISLRGHRDYGPIIDMQEPEENDGNFRALLRFRARSGDDELQKHFNTASKNAMYISPRIQNDIIAACNTVILGEIVQKINNDDGFCVLADETTDQWRLVAKISGGAASEKF